MTPVFFEPEAQSEALDAFDWYESRQTGLGVRFRDALDAAVLRIGESPTAFPIRHRDLRRILVEPLPCAVHYRVYPDRVS